ncbi:hypothetical protein N7495_004949 [Penicillium taxi]|uniref:uncharacterized protein n=1 Tax=Penicillium taxi TaxID=168475 RepID=UPI002544F623|nr:uncharacterized protein N7495_004949 [Penicillium taxi]KAJ5893258.1 hypothetical protein N7495_004949 [Penicillium taxi]
MAPNIAIVYFSAYGHVATLAEAEKKGVEAAGGKATILRIDGAHAGAGAYDVVTPKDLLNYDGILFGIPTRFGNHPAQWREFWDKTGGIWQSCGYWGKYAGLFISTGTQGGGQESTALATLSTFAHHGLIYVPLGYKHTSAQLANLDEIHGGSPWGAGSFAAGDGSRQPTKLELEIAEAQGKAFYETVAKAV